MFRAVRQVLLLAVALAGLILLPAHLSGGLLAGQRALRAAASFSIYLLFFASGTLRRMFRHGRLASRQQDAQRGSGGSRAALLLFAAVAVPAGHYGAWWYSSLAASSPGALSGTAQLLLPALGYALMVAAWALNAAAAAALGKASRHLTNVKRGHRLLLGRRPACC